MDKPRPSTATWLRCTPQNIKDSDFSAAAYYFGRELQQKLGVPVGLIHSSFGGTRIEAWMPHEAFASDPSLRDLEHERFKAWVPGVQPTELYTSMVEPYIPFALRGFLWYQGEANCMNAEHLIYAAKMRALIRTWRAAWHEGNAPFEYALLAPFDYSKWTTFDKHLTPVALPAFWEAQAKVLDVPNTGAIVTTDLVTNFHDIHPTDKRDVGVRFADLALEATYHRKDVRGYSPQYESMQVRRDGSVEIQFAHAAGGLHSRDGQPLSDFTVAGADEIFHPAQAVADGDKVKVSSPEVSVPVAVRFGWRETANPNLANGSGLPAIPFRTDTWPLMLEVPPTAGTPSK